jgi:hypothetical protein
MGRQSPICAYIPVSATDVSSRKGIVELGKTNELTCLRMTFFCCVCSEHATARWQVDNSNSIKKWKLEEKRKRKKSVEYYYQTLNIVLKCIIVFLLL